MPVGTPDLRYAARYYGSKCSVQILVSNALARKAGMTGGEPIRLDFDAKARLGRLLPVRSERRVWRERKGSLCAHWPHNGDIAEHLPAVKDGSATVGLVVVEVSKDNGIVFELPAKWGRE